MKVLSPERCTDHGYTTGIAVELFLPIPSLLSVGLYVVRAGIL